jgi:hypothetical protein
MLETFGHERLDSTGVEPSFNTLAEPVPVRDGLSVSSPKLRFVIGFPTPSTTVACPFIRSSD